MKHWLRESALWNQNYLLDTMAERIRIMESEPERSKEMRRLLVDNYSVFFVIQGDKVIVTDVLYSASDIESRLKG